jgi:hypothetical protein
MPTNELAAPSVEALRFVHDWMWEHGEATEWPAANLRDAARILEAYQAKAWRPIESARKNGDRFLLWMQDDWCCVGFWDRDPEEENGQCWRSDGDCERIEPTHWMKLPNHQPGTAERRRN